MKKIITFQELILKLQQYWIKFGCTIIQPLDIEVGAGTFHPMTCLSSLKNKPIFFAYVQTSRRPSDGRYGKNINRLQQYFQFQIIIKPIPKNFQDLYLNSLKFLGIDLYNNDILFVEDNWENTTLGAWGIGWEIRLNGIEITQFTYFQQICGLNCLATGEITYGLERLAMHLQCVDNVYDIIWNKNNNEIIKYGHLFKTNELEKSIYNFEYSNVEFLFDIFNKYEKEINELLKREKILIMPAYEYLLKLTHLFNLIDSRKAISVSERQNFILKIRKLTKTIAIKYCNNNDDN